MPGICVVISSREEVFCPREAIYIPTESPSTANDVHIIVGDNLSRTRYLDVHQNSAQKI